MTDDQARLTWSERVEIEGGMEVDGQVRWAFRCDRLGDPEMMAKALDHFNRGARVLAMFPCSNGLDCVSPTTAVRRSPGTDLVGWTPDGLIREPGPCMFCKIFGG